MRPGVPGRRGEANANPARRRGERRAHPGGSARPGLPGVRRARRRPAGGGRGGALGRPAAFGDPLSLTVPAAERAKGHGRRIVAALQTELRGRGRTLLVGTANSALDNIAFYQKCGFRMYAVRRDHFAYIQPPLTDNGIVMRDMSAPGQEDAHA
jgi:GNAT superfamily N-acetyltransferase